MHFDSGTAPPRLYRGLDLPILHDMINRVHRPVEIIIILPNERRCRIIIYT
jgi:hypothetical protein